VDAQFSERLRAANLIRPSTMMLEYSFNVTSVISIGHLSTEKLAGAALGNITAGVTGLSIVQGFACALDSLLPQAWTGEHPSHVGLWSQRMLVLMMFLMMVRLLYQARRSTRLILLMRKAYPRLMA
jgi:MATE family multidrug resistance protein